MMENDQRRLKEALKKAETNRQYISSEVGKAAFDELLGKYQEGIRETEAVIRGIRAERFRVKNAGLIGMVGNTIYQTQVERIARPVEKWINGMERLPEGVQKAAGPVVRTVLRMGGTVVSVIPVTRAAGDNVWNAMGRSAAMSSAVSLVSEALEASLKRLVK